MREAAGIFCALAGLVLPGLGWALALRWPLPWLAAGLASAGAILAGVLVLVLAGVPVTFASLGLWLVLVGAPGWVRAWAARAAVPAPVAGAREWWLALPVLPLLAVAAWRALVQPLSGADAGFRWNELALLLAERGNLDFYPPTTVADFTAYFWADGISPLVASLYAWTYLAVGSTDRIWTAIPVLLQVAGLLAVLFGLGRQWGGARGGWFACALGGGTMLLQFACNLGQETGLTALGTGGMIIFLLRWRETREARLLVPAALAATLAACAREYGAIAALAGAGWIFSQGRAWRPALGFALGAALLPLWWHGRVTLLTGNPLYAQEFADWPTNPVFAAWMQNYRAIYGDALAQPATWREIARIGLVTALPALLGLASGLALGRKQAGWGLGWALTAGFVAIWIWSMPFTAGGPFYSMRVLSPLLVLGCASGGACLAHWVPGRTHLAGVMIGLTLLSVDASLRAWTIPGNPYSLAPAAWPDAGHRIQLEFERTDRPFLAQVAQVAGGRVLSDSAGLREFFQREGKTYSPLWSPDVAWLFSGEVQPDAAARLRALGFSHLLLKRTSISIDFLQKHGVLASLHGHLRVVMANPTFVLLELEPESS
jgi:hypothetical protein